MATKKSTQAPTPNAPTQTAVPAPPADPKAYYQALFDSLGRAFWATSDLNAKNQIQGARDAAYAIVTAINQAQLDQDTTELEALSGTVAKTNVALIKLKAGMDSLVHNIAVAAEVEDAIAKVLSLAGKLM